MAAFWFCFLPASDPPKKYASSICLRIWSRVPGWFHRVCAISPQTSATGRSSVFVTFSLHQTRGELRMWGSEGWSKLSGKRRAVPVLKSGLVQPEQCLRASQKGGAGRGEASTKDHEYQVVFGKPLVFCLSTPR